VEVKREVKRLENHDSATVFYEDVHAGLSFVCSGCGKGLLMEDIGKKWGKCEFCGNPICITCSHYVGAMIRGLWKDYIDIRKVCRKCAIKL